MGKERKILECHPDITPLGRDVGHIAPADLDGACRRFLDTRDEAQKKRLARARAAEDDDDLSGLRRKCEILEDLERTEGFREVP